MVAQKALAEAGQRYGRLMQCNSKEQSAMRFLHRALLRANGLACPRAYFLSIEKRPGPVTASASRPPAMLMFL
jgi:hypothetical protein